MPAGAWAKRGRRLALAAAAFVLAAAVAEAALQVAYRLRHGAWLSPPDTAWSRGVFEFHPFLAVAPRPGASARSSDGIAVTIGDDGTRSLGAAATPPRADAKTVACLGGSSTFGALVSDADTWPAALQTELGGAARVLNMGCPGYTTAENVIQTALIVPARDPRVCVYLEGWNDARNMNLDGLEPDYSGWHGRSQLANCQVIPSQEPDTRVALLWFLRRVRDGFSKDAYAEFRPRPPADPAPVDRVDPAAAALYRRNLATLMTLCRARGAVPVFVPQVLNYRLLDRDGAGDGWAPRVRDRFWKTTMDAYNAEMREATRAEHAYFADAVLAHDWLATDFLDAGHFSPEGNRTFARLIAPVVAEACAQAR
jgi:lysophospholipase L1-like esterase